MGEWGPSVNKCLRAHKMGGGLRPAVSSLVNRPIGLSHLSVVRTFETDQAYLEERLQWLC